MSEAALKEQIATELGKGQVSRAKEDIRILPQPPKTPERLAAEKRGAEILAKLRAKILSLKR